MDSRVAIVFEYQKKTMKYSVTATEVHADEVAKQQNAGSLGREIS